MEAWDVSDQGENRPSSKSGFERRPVLGALLALVVMASVLCVAGSAGLTSQTQRELSEATQEFLTRRASLEQAINSASLVAGSAADARSSEPATTERLLGEIACAQGSLDAGASESPSSALPWERDRAAAESSWNLARQTSFAEARIRRAVADFSRARLDGALDLSRGELGEDAEDAAAAEERLSGKVSDQALLEELDAEAEEAAELAKDTSATVHELSQATKHLNEAVNAANDSHEEWVEKKREEERAAAERARRAQARPAATVSTRATSSSSSRSNPYAGAWHVSYYTNIYGAVDAGGAVTQWAPRYFVAHRHLANGARIASCPTYVVVDGITYRFVSSMHAARGTTYDQVQGFATANGGIGFQTCDPNGSTMLVTHYEPA